MAITKSSLAQVFQSPEILLKSQKSVQTMDVSDSTGSSLQAVAGTKFSLQSMAVYTAGNMIGTGTHQTLIALAESGCGNVLWANFLLAGILVTLSALPLLHLYHKFPSNDCLQQAAAAGLGPFWGKWLAFVNGQLISIELIFAVTMQATFFGKNLAARFTDVDDVRFSTLLSIALLIFLCILYRKVGALFTANIAWALGVLELCTVGILILSSAICVLASKPIRPVESLVDWSQTTFTKFPSGIHMAIFAYGGFPGMIQSADLVENPGRNVPLGIVCACLMTTIIYTAMSVSVLLVSEPAAVASFRNGFDSLRNVLPEHLLAAISCTVLSSVANNIMENALVVMENMKQMFPMHFSRPADSFTFAAIGFCTFLNSYLKLNFLGDAIDFALILQFAIFAILCLSSQGGSLGARFVAFVSLLANSLLASWHLYHASAMPMFILMILVALPIFVPQRDKRE